MSTQAPDRLAYSRDLWPRYLLSLRAGDAAPHPPDVVVWPETVSEVQAIVRLCAERGVPIVPFGAGSGVCGGAVLLDGGVVVDLKRMRRLVDLNADAGTATFETGILGSHLERQLEGRGHTLGHFPASILCSTLGGWLAARSAGQCSSRYGKIEDMVRSVEFVTGAGEVLTTGVGSGPDWTQLLVGSEGTLGIFTRAELTVHSVPEVRYYRGFAMPRLTAGCEAIRRVLQRGLRPAVLRLYDPVDTFLNGRLSKHADKAPGEEGGLRRLGATAEREGGRVAESLERWVLGAALRHPLWLQRLGEAALPVIGGECLLVAGCEGERRLGAIEAAVTFDEIVRAGGRDLGPGPGDDWLRHRYDVSFKQSKVFCHGGIADTMEVATSWSGLLDLYRAVREAVSPHALVLAHFSHAYVDGCSIYFTMVAGAPSDEPPGVAERRYDEMWRAALGAATRVGATISHHHGVGLSKAAWMPSEHGEAMAVLRAVKRLMDPRGIMNPGKLGL